VKTFNSSIAALLLFLSFSFFTAPLRAQNISAGRCEQVFISQHSQPSFVQRIRNYSREVRDTKGVRLFLKDFQPHDVTKWQGFLTKNRIDANESKFGRYFLAITQYVPRKLGEAFSRESGYLFTPLMGLYNVTVKKPTVYLTSKLTNRKKEPAFFIKIPAIIAMSLSVYIPADMVYQNRLDAHVQSEIASNAAAYDHAIQSDYRYNKIKTSLKNGEITKEAAEHEAYLMSLAYSSYFEYRNSQTSEPNLKSEMGLINHVLFVHLRSVMTDGVTKLNPKTGYLVPDKAVGELSESQKLELFANNHQRYLKYQLIQEMVGKTEVWQEIVQSEKLRTVVDSITQDPFTKELLQLREQGLISDGQLQSYLQEDAHWQNKFQDWNVLGIQRLKNINGEYVNQPLTLSDVREEVLIEINANKP
jgi:hypothetical protein